ncbi:phosphoribosylglycinamide formyltransferase [Chroococcidiopsis sp. CCALA 051]|uniref:phosphoribosylglycinamide formyltransferase n=1 Tax=Chroococcidiopsis sp. CCALA 051 TaxID=869949 RepID=UPI000D0DD3D4|nr:phosphoribosylglycinamide formyltransferase [Chroococcidiopsis sp. CCALA 051]MBE9018128.1 phosphoribosylglycinamide formyltransferase [Chroococcidiopsidales cyanobacterium LEGE 13417]PSM48402.1 phosphoribosylglycinamide formyltransferase [Chroococcidiopsis sp. CCALA 051]
MTIPATTASTASLISPIDPTDLWIPGEPIKLGILASGNGSNFEAVAEAIAQGRLNAKIQVLIYNNPEAKVAVRAANRDVPAVLLNHRHFPSREDLDRQIVQTLHQYDVSWVIMAGWMRIVTPVLINAFIERIINIHPSLLPSFRGIQAVEQALAAGVKIAGCTVHIVVPEVDSGRILLQAAVPVLPDDTPQTLHQRIHQQEYRILPAAIALAAKQGAGTSWELGAE